MSARRREVGGCAQLAASNPSRAATCIIGGVNEASEQGVSSAIAVLFVTPVGPDRTGENHGKIEPHARNLRLSSPRLQRALSKRLSVSVLHLVD